MTRSYDSPEVVQRVSDANLSTLRTTIHALEERGMEVPAGLATEYEDKQAHLKAVKEFADRMVFGSAVHNHTEDVLDFLIERGWTPPAGVLLTNEVR